MLVVEREPYRWFPHAGGRHAIPIDAGPGDTVLTACGEKAVLPRDGMPRLEHEPECAECDTRWRRQRGLPTREELLSGAIRRTCRAAGTAALSRRPVRTAGVG
ncbi:zinc finger protein [Saccharothrix xinjiangensis]|uniref:Zinc finger protein n=1 Tax=Saccharothrix xinjiangensis TaxID=204798 RepID=A0ABV9XZI9_9PSEU